MSRSIKNLLLVCGLLAGLAGARERVWDRAQLTASLRRDESVAGQVVRLDAVYAGVQTDRQGRTHHLFQSQDTNTLYLCYFQGTERGREPGAMNTFTGRVIRVELNGQDLRDNRIYALWLRILPAQP